MDADDQVSIVKRIVKELNLDEKLYSPTAIHNIISNAKNNLIGADTFSSRSYRDEINKRVYERYEQALRTSNALDFDDLLLWAVRLFEENPDVRETYGKRFEHVLVDEFQDTNLVQYDLLSHLSSVHHALFRGGR